MPENRNNGLEGTRFLFTTAIERGLAGSYARQLSRMGADVLSFDIHQALRRSVRAGPLGRLISSFLIVEPWLRKVNRDLVIKVQDTRPDVLIVFGGAPVLAGAIAQIKAAYPSTRCVLVWPDTLVNIRWNIRESLALYDVVATYSKATIEVFETMGAQRVIWLPFALDRGLYPVLERDEEPPESVDFVLIGNYRPEREEIVNVLLEAGFTARVWGGEDWGKNASRARLRQYWAGDFAFGRKCVVETCRGRFALNVIDKTNYPGANMRFFEIFSSRRVEVCSPCPEMETQFRDMEQIVYFENHAQLVERCRKLLTEPDKRAHIAQAAFETAMAGHEFTHRCTALLEALQDL